MLYLAALAVVITFGLALWWLFGGGNGNRPKGSDLAEFRQAENKVKVSDPITRRDIDVLGRYGSSLLQDAIELRRAQILRGDHPDYPPGQNPPPSG